MPGRLAFVCASVNLLVKVCISTTAAAAAAMKDSESVTDGVGGGDGGDVDGANDQPLLCISISTNITFPGGVPRPLNGAAALKYR